jgi:hypothetical protein
LYGCEVSSLSLREERRLKKVENSVPRKIFGIEWDEVTVEWRRLHNEKINACILTKYHSGDQVEKSETGGACSMYGEEERFIQGFGRKTRRKEST